MTKRKSILIVADIVLLAVLTVQCIMLSGDGSKTYRLKETPDEIIIENRGQKVLLSFENNEWVVGDKKYPTNMGTVDSVIDSLTEIRCIDKAGSLSKENAAEKYELTDDTKIKVTAKREGNVLRTVEIGKNASTGSQSFITIDGGKDIYLATGGLKYSFDKDVNALRSKIVWDIDESEISSVEVRRYNSDSSDSSGNSDSSSQYSETGEKPLRYSVIKSGSGENLKWSVEGTDIDLDPEKAQEWFDGLGILSTDYWLDESADNGGELAATIKIVYGYDTLVVDIYEKTINNNTEADSGAESSEQKKEYYGICSQNPYPFKLTSYTMERLNKNPEDLAK